MNLAYISDFKVSLRYVGRPCLKKRGVFGEGRMAVAECLPSIYKALNLIPGINKNLKIYLEAGYVYNATISGAEALSEIRSSRPV